MLKWVLVGLLLGLVMCASIGGAKKDEPATEDPISLDFEVFDTDTDGKLSEAELIELFDHKVLMRRYSSRRASA
jgi:Ca2+-binding EF-hand superfamily protein